MNEQQKTAWRAAQIVRKNLLALSDQAPSIELPDQSWDNLQRITRGIACAHRRGWRHPEARFRVPGLFRGSRPQRLGGHPHPRSRARR